MPSTQVKAVYKARTLLYDNMVITNLHFNIKTTIVNIGVSQRETTSLRFVLKKLVGRTPAAACC